MSTIAVAGLYNLETNVQISGFPLPYFPVCYPFHQITQVHAGVGYNVSLALQRLGQQVRLASLVGQDEAGHLAQAALQQQGLEAKWMRPDLALTPQAVILVAPDGRRQIHCDLKDIQEQAYPATLWPALLQGAQLAVACNINFARPMLAEAANRGVPIATDVHVLSDYDDAYNRDYMALAQVLFLSHEQLPEAPEQAMAQLYRRYRTPVLVLTLGADGALIQCDGGPVQHLPARPSRPVVSSIGAGDAVFSAFVDQYLRLGPEQAVSALARAQVYAGWKIGEAGASNGLLTQSEFQALLAGAAR